MIPTELNQLLGDCLYWVEHETYGADEIAIRLKHRIVQIHCFANGNGRHSRLLADILVNHVFKQPVFTWGSQSILRPNETRENYIDALRKADLGDYKKLIAFARS